MNALTIPNNTKLVSFKPIEEAFKPYDDTFTVTMNVDVEANKMLLANFPQVCLYTDVDKVKYNKALRTSSLNFLKNIIINNKPTMTTVFRVKKRYGRLFPIKNNSYVSLHRPMRHAIAHNLYRDFDAKNCHPVIVEQLYDWAFKKSPTYLCEYNLNREKYFETLYEYGLIRDECKKLTFVFLYDGSVDKFFNVTYPQLGKNLQTNENLKELYHKCKLIKSEILALRKWIKSNYSDIWKELGYNKDKDKSRIDAGKFSTFIQNIERNIIIHCYYNLKSHGISVDDIQHDGLYISKTCSLPNDEICKIMNDCVLQRFGFDIQFEHKPFDQPEWFLKLTETYEMYIEKHGDIVKPVKKLFIETSTLDKNNETLELEAILTDQFKPLWNKKDIKLLNFLASKSNNMEYCKIKTKYHSNLLFNNTNEDVAQAYYVFYGFNYVWINDILFYYDGKMWDKNGEVFLRKYLLTFTSVYTSYQSELLAKSADLQRDGKTDEADLILKKTETLYETVLKLKSSSFLENVVKMFKLKVFSTDIHFEQNPYIFAFKNKIFDIRDGSEVSFTTSTDYMYINTGYDWVEPDDDSIEKLNDLINSIFPKSKERDTYLTILSSGILGEVVEKFIIANGSGGNGKGVINELMLSLVGNYGYRGANTVLLNPFKDGANPEVANMNDKRFVIFTEPDDDKKICSSVIKELTGGTQMNARKCYSNDTVVNIKATFILECNKRLNINGRIDQAIKRRLIDVLFRSSFVSNPDEYKGKHVYQGDAFYKTNDFKDQYRCALFKILLPYIQRLIKKNKDIDQFVCEKIKVRTDQYLQNTDDLKAVFDRLYEPTKNDKDIVKVTDFYEHFKESDYFRLLSKKQQRERNKHWFLEEIQSNVNFKKNYVKRERRKDVCEDLGVTQLRNVLVGFKSIESSKSDKLDDPVVPVPVQKDIYPFCCSEV